MAATALFACQCRARHHQRQGVQISQLVAAAPGLFTFGKFHRLELLDGFVQLFSVAHDSYVPPHDVPDLRQYRANHRWSFCRDAILSYCSVLGCFFLRCLRIVRQGRGAPRQRLSLAFSRGCFFHHGLARERAKHQPFEQGIAGQPVGSVDASRSRFSRGIQPGKGSAALQIGLYSAHHVVCRGAHRSQVACQVQSKTLASLVNSGEAFRQELLALLCQVQVNVCALRALHLADDGACHHVARRQLLRFVIFLHKTLQPDVAQHTAFAAQRFRQQKPWRSLDGQRCGMKLDELHVGQHRAGIVCNGHAVAGGHVRIGRLAIDLPQSAGGKQHRARPQFVQGTIGFIDEAQSSNLAALQDQFRRECVRPQMQARNGVRACEQRPADFPARGISTRVENARTAVRRFARKRQLGSRAVEFRSPLDELRDVLGAFFHQQRHGFFPAQAVSGVDGVLLVQADFVFIGERHGNTALRPGRGRIT